MPEGAYTGPRLAAWISSNFATATYSETTNSLSVAYDGNRLILNDLELRQQFPDLPPSPSAWTTCWARALSPAGSRFEFVKMMAHNEVYLRCAQLANASSAGQPGRRRPLQDHAEERSGYHCGARTTRGPVTLRHMRFRLTDLDGNVVRLRGSSLSFVLYLDHV